MNRRSILIALAAIWSFIIADVALAQSPVAIRCKSGVTTFDCGDSSNTALRVSIVSGGGSGGTASSFGSAFPSTGTAIGFSDGTNMRPGQVVDADTGAGTSYTQVVNLVRRASGGPAELIGQTTMANSIPVAIASNQGALTTQPNTIASANNDGASASVTGASSTVLASFSTRAFASVCALSTNTANVYIKLGTTATSSDMILVPGACFNTPPGVVYSGRIDAISASGTQTVTMVEW